MLELSSAFIKPIKTAAPATDPERTPCIFVNAINISAFTERILAARLGKVMNDFARLAIQSVQGAREQAYPQSAIRLPINRLDPAGREAIGVAGAMPVIAELFFPEIENIEPRILSSHPQHATPILIDRHNRVTVEAIRVGLIVLKPARETFCAPVKVVKTQARWHP
jgi:hypothetical protein